MIAVPLAPGEQRHDIGTVEGYCRVFLEHALRHPEFGAGLRAHAAANCSMTAEPAAGEAHARAALAGNPSDGYGGAVLAVTLPAFRARAEIGAADQLRVDPPSQLVCATVQRFARAAGAPSAQAAAVTWSTTIPRRVGLGGSSAIVIAVLRALCARHGTALDRSALAELALAVEVEELGIAAGLQDRVAQSYGGLMFMDFDPALGWLRDARSRRCCRRC